MWRMDLEKDEYQLLSLITQSFTIDEALTELKMECEDDANCLETSLTKWFNRWMRHRLLSEIIVPSVGSVSPPDKIYELQSA